MAEVTSTPTADAMEAAHERRALEIIGQIDQWTSRDPINWNAPVLSANDAYALRQYCARADKRAAEARREVEMLRKALHEIVTDSGFGAHNRMRSVARRALAEQQP